jgi:hypothetical protein
VPIAAAILDLLWDYATFNPHATFCFRHNGRTVELPAIVGADWSKWKTDYPTSCHWYSTDDLRTLIAGYIANGHESMTVRDLIKSFRGLSGTAKQKRVAADANLTSKCLSDMIRDENIDLEMVERLRQAMCAASQPVRAIKLGLIGEEALTKRLIEVDDVIPATVTYVKQLSNDDALPTVVEVAFGLSENAERQTHIRFGLNFAPALNIPMRSLPSWLQYSRMIEGNDAACLIVHATRPRFEFTSRAKAMLT